MAVSVLPPPRKAGRLRPVWVRWAALITLLVGEILLLSLVFDAEDAAEQEGLLAKLLKHGFVPRALVTVIFSALVFGLMALKGKARAIPAEYQERPARFWAYLAAHLCALGVFTALTPSVLKPAGGGLNRELFVCWGVVGLIAVVLWGLTLFSARVWRQLFRSHVSLIITVALVGLAAGLVYKVDVVWRPLSESTLWMVNGWLRLLGWDPICIPDELVIGTQECTVVIDRACSGYEGIGLVCLFLGVYLWWFRSQFRFPQALLLVPLGIALSWVGNTIRIAALLVVGSVMSPEVAQTGFHSQAGWLLFNGLALGMVVVSQRLRMFSSAPQPMVATTGSWPAAPYLVPFLAVVVTAMVTGAFSIGLDWLYPLRVLAGLSCLWIFRDYYRRWTWSWSWSAAGVGVAVFVAWIGLDWLLMSNGDENGLFAQRLWDGPGTAQALAWLAFRVVGAVIVAPLIEELAFRAYLPRRLMSADFERIPIGRMSWLAFLISSALFGLLHGQRWLAGILAGMAYAALLCRRGRISEAVLAHSVTNLLLAIYVLSTGEWALW